MTKSNKDRVEMNEMESGKAMYRTNQIKKMAVDNISKIDKHLECVSHENRKGTMNEWGKYEIKGWGQEESQCDKIHVT